MKKVVFGILKVVLSLGCLIGSYFFVLSLLTGSSLPVEKIDISQFKGRILPDYSIQPGTFTITTPLSEALTFEEDAILSFGGSGIQIWKPDQKTSGVFLTATKRPSHVSHYYEIVINDNQIILSEQIAGRAYMVSILASIVFTVIIGTITKRVVKTIKK